MKIKSALLVFFACIVFTGCSNKPEPAAEKVKTVAHEDNQKSGDAPISPATTPEELAQLPAGTLTKDFTVEQETTMWSKREVPTEIRETFLTEMTSITKRLKIPKNCIVH